jgi:MOSC domain-containing protein YiiM
MGASRHLTADELESGLGEIQQSPTDSGVLRLIVRRPASGQREELQQGTLDLAVGLVGDYWSAARSPDVDAQITVMNARAIALIAVDPQRRSLAGDQLYVDLDLSGDNLPPGTRLTIGSAVIEVTASPHTGCRNFREWYGLDAMRFVNSPVGRQLNLRGVNARVVRPGVIQIGGLVKKLRS